MHSFKLYGRVLVGLSLLYDLFFSLRHDEVDPLMVGVGIAFAWVALGKLYRRRRDEQARKLLLDTLKQNELDGVLVRLTKGNVPAILTCAACDAPDIQDVLSGLARRGWEIESQPSPPGNL